MNQGMLPWKREVVAYTGFSEDLAELMERLQSCVHGFERVRVVLRPPCKVSKVEKGCDTLHHLSRNEASNGTKIDL